MPGCLREWIAVRLRTIDGGKTGLSDYVISVTSLKLAEYLRVNIYKSFETQCWIFISKSRLLRL